LRLNGNQLVLDPHIPESWRGFKVRYRRAATTYVISVDNRGGGGGGVSRITFDGAGLPDAALPLVDDGREHDVRVVLG
jgi:cellobiose phosphorylase